MKYTLYGFGENGTWCMDFLGTDSVSRIIDNNYAKKQFDGKKIYTYEDYRKNVNDDDWIIVTPDNNGAIIKQLVSEGITKFITRKEITGFFLNGLVELPVGDNRDRQKVLSVLGVLKSDYSEKLKKGNADIEFFLVDSFEIAHYLKIYWALAERGLSVSVVAEHPWINPAGGWFDYDNAIKELKKNNVLYSDIANPNAKVAVTTQYPEELAHYNNSKRILFPYGVFLMKKSAFTFFKGVADSFDCIFTHGDLQIKILRELGYQTDAISISYPKYFGRSADRDSVLKKFNINTNKPILVYLPTWDEYGSIVEASKELDKLRDEFYVVVKPHHCTLHLSSKVEEKKMLYNSCDKVLEKADLLEIASIADLAVCDAKTGAVSEIVFLNSSIKMVLIYKNCSVEDFFVDYNNLFCGVTTIDNLDDVINGTMEYDAYVEPRKHWISEAFSQSIEEGIERGVSKIQEYLNEK